MALARVCLSAYLISIPIGIPQARQVMLTALFCSLSIRELAVASPGTVELVAINTSFIVPLLIRDSSSLILISAGPIPGVYINPE